MADVEKLSAVRLRRLGDAGHVAEPHMEAVRDVHAGLDRLDDDVHPVVGQRAAGIDHPDHQRLRAGRDRRGDVHVLQADIRAAAFHAHLADAPVAPPVDDAGGGFGRKLVRGVAQKQQVRLRDLHDGPRRLDISFQR